MGDSDGMVSGPSQAPEARARGSRLRLLAGKQGPQRHGVAAARTDRRASVVRADGGRQRPRRPARGLGGRDGPRARPGPARSGTRTPRRGSPRRGAPRGRSSRSWPARTDAGSGGRSDRRSERSDASGARAGGASAGSPVATTSVGPSRSHRRVVLAPSPPSATGEEEIPGSFRTASARFWRAEASPFSRRPASRRAVPPTNTWPSFSRTNRGGAAEGSLPGVPGAVSRTITAPGISEALAGGTPGARARAARPRSAAAALLTGPRPPAPPCSCGRSPWRGTGGRPRP